MNSLGKIETHGIAKTVQSFKHGPDYCRGGGIIGCCAAVSGFCIKFDIPYIEQ